MARIAKRLGHLDRLSALIAILDAEGKILSSQAWPSDISPQLKNALLRELRPFLEIERPISNGDATYEIASNVREPLERLIEALGEIACVTDEPAD